MASTIEPGWYSSDEHGRRYWTGQEWLARNPDDPPVVSVGPEPPVADDASPVRKRGNRKWIGIATGAVALVLVAGWFIYLRPTVSGNAVAACEDQLRNSLKSPTSAVFYESHTITASEQVMTFGLAYADYVARTNDGVDVTKVLPELMSQAQDAQTAQDRDIATGDYTMYVTGEVDAQNGFGGTSRSDWLCAAFVKDGSVTGAVVEMFGDEMWDAFD